MDKAKIIKTLSEILEAEQSVLYAYNNDAPLEQIGLDSLKFIQFIVRIEKDFHIEIHDSDLLFVNFATLAGIYKTLGKYFKKNIELKKVIVTDCDNVLWQGVSGEETLLVNANIEKYQETLVKLRNSGVLICICSKNEKANIDDAFRTLPMIVKREHIIAERINQLDKVTNIVSIAQELNLLTDSFVFVDDREYELGLVESMIQGITVVKADNNTTEWVDVLSSLFDAPSRSIERTKWYIQQKEREKDKLHFNSVAEYNASLNTIVTCEEASFEQAERIAELSQRTNQFNLAESRYTDNEVKAMIGSDDHCVLAVSATDRYGDMGIVGSAIIRLRPQIIIEAFMLSCRAFDRGFENTMILKIKEYAQAKKLLGIYNQNERNKRYASFYGDNGVDSL